VTSQAGLDGSVALITGASSGIGAATARLLAGEGVAVALAARRIDRLKDLAEEIGSAGGRALPVEADVTSRADAESAVERAVTEFGRLDILVNNAGVMLLGPILDAPVEEWERMIRLNVLGLLYCSKAAVPHLLQAAEQGPRGVADLVNISSVAGRQVRLGSGVYNASKHAVGAFSESLRQEVTARNLRVSLVEPGAVDTELPTHNREEIREGLDERFADMERLEDHDIADAIRYIVSRPRRVSINEILIRPTDQAN
jgi:NADP-dependent 3-hydroxy acid dehydrogenase YdfG